MDGDMGRREDADGEAYIIKLRGLPFSSKKQDILEFLKGVNVCKGVEGIHLTEIRPGRPTGECYVELVSLNDVELARSKDKQNIGSRYVEVFVSGHREMQWAMSQSSINTSPVLPSGGGVVKLRGLPFGCSKGEIIHFFNGLAVSAEGVTILVDSTGRSTGEAFVSFPDRETAERALQKDRQEIGHRYIEVFPSCPQEVRSALSMLQGPPRGPIGGARPGPYDRYGGRFQDKMRPPPRGGFRGDNNNGNWNRNGPWKGAGGIHSIHMRGLPFKASLHDIAYFFKPIRPLNINILFDNNDRPSGQADVEFECHDDAVRAMRMDRNTMDNRYIELFLNSSPGGGGGGGGRPYGGSFTGSFNRNNNYR